MPGLPEVERGRRIAEGVAAGCRIDKAWCDDDRIVFTVTKKSRGDAGARIEKAIADRLGVETRVTVVARNAGLQRTPEIIEGEEVWRTSAPGAGSA